MTAGGKIDEGFRSVLICSTVVKASKNEQLSQAELLWHMFRHDVHVLLYYFYMFFCCYYVIHILHCEQITTRKVY